MQVEAAPLEPPSADHPSSNQMAEGMEKCARVLLDLVDIGSELAQMLIRQARSAEENAAADPASAPSPTRDIITSYASVTRAVRRTVMLYRKLGEPAKKPANRTAARKRIIRDVEDAIHCHAPADRQETLHAELMERLDRPDLDNEITDRPVAAIVTDIIHDLGLAGLHGTHTWKRRIPHDIAILNARAEQASGTAPSHQLLALLATAPPQPARHNTPIADIELSKISDDDLDALIRQCGPMPDS